jgi:hypothetical protein
MKKVVLELKILRCKIGVTFWGTMEYFANYMINLMARWMNFLDKHK